jgi:hypothetical protein
MKSNFPGLIGILFATIGLLVLSWLMVHFLAFFGIFLSVAYPIWWLFAPKYSICFICRSKKEGEYCSFCRQKVHKAEGVLPKSFTSAILNGVMVLVISLVSVGIVFGEGEIIFNLGALRIPKTVSFVIPPKGQYRLGEVFPMKLEIAGIKTPINTVQADLGFDSSKIEVVDISTEGSFATIFIQKEINNEGGYARLTGGLPNPGFSDSYGIFGSVLFKGKVPGIVEIKYLPTSMVLANDSRGTNVLKTFGSVSYLILPEKISAKEEELQKQINSQTTVLGEQTVGTQMIFYDEGKSVLGAKAEEEIVKSNIFDPAKWFLGILEKIDSIIINIWLKILGR